MKNTGIKVLCGALLCGAFLGANNVSAAYNYDTTSEFSAQDTYIRVGTELCVKSTVLQGSRYMYAWDTSNSNHPLRGWPGVDLVEAGDGLYCYEHDADDGYQYDMVIFNNNGGSQTVDLSVINDSAGLVKSLVYMFDESDYYGDDIYGNRTYKGRWAVNDTSALVDMVAVAKGLDANRYTIASYEAVADALGSDVAVADVTVENQGQYDLGADYISKLNLSNDVLGKLTIASNGVDYSSAYLDAYNTLGAALNNLVERKMIVVDDGIVNGNVVAEYKPNSDSEINIELTPDFGYEIGSIIVKQIASYDDETKEMTFGETTEIEVVPGEDTYSYAFGDADVKGAYISATFKAKSYIITVDGEEYTFDFGTTYEQMLEGINLEKEGYKFLYLVDEDGDKVPDDYVVRGDAEFTAVYEEEGAATDEEDIAVPDTGSEQGFGEGAKYSLIGCASVGAVMGAALMVAKQRRDDCKNK